MRAVEDATILKLSAIWGVVIIMIVDAVTWKIDHALWSLGVSVISGLAGYQLGVIEREREADSSK